MGEERRKSGAEGVEVRGMHRDELPEAVAVLARGMRDNPLHVAAYGEDPHRRWLSHGRLVAGLFSVSQELEFLCAVRGGAVLGVTAVAPPGTCRMSPGQRLRMLPHLTRLGPSAALRVLSWTAAWGARDPDEPHAHLGPLAVDAGLQGRGIGSLIMREHCARLDQAGTLGYLETDKGVNVRFYERFGYEVTEEAPVLGVPNWFMSRRPGAR
ncbi:GNAT family N-acetyltransferase [Nocardiopsis sp. CNT-189]|uniref:GNAT family N-acetyltransferase n=1 Tax=Nocardiopsis oceanisediminis TaxID=2816862 RepID=UPI003B2EB9F5